MKNLKNILLPGEALPLKRIAGVDTLAINLQYYGIVIYKKKGIIYLN